MKRPICLYFIAAMMTAALFSGSRADSTSVSLTGMYWGGGAGVALGDAPLFTMWQNTLPKDLSELGLTQRFGMEFDTAAGMTNPMSLTYKVVEAPDQFNFFIPFHLATYLMRENYAASAAMSLYYNTKQWQAGIVRHLDTENRNINLYSTMRFISLTFEATYHLTIPARFFSINGSNLTWVSLMLGGSPFQYISRAGAIDINAPEEDARLRAAAAFVADSVKEAFSDFSANGAALSWRLGVTTSRIKDGGGGLLLGLYYGGAYSGWYWRDSKRVMNGDIDRLAEGEKRKPLAFMSTRLEFQITMIRGGKKDNSRSAHIEESPDKHITPDQQETTGNKDEP